MFLSRYSNIAGRTGRHWSNLEPGALLGRLSLERGLLNDLERLLELDVLHWLSWFWRRHRRLLRVGLFFAVIIIIALRQDNFSFDRTINLHCRIHRLFHKSLARRRRVFGRSDQQCTTVRK